MSYRSVKGMDDILPQDAWLWHELEQAARAQFESSGYQEIRTPILEDTALFVRGIGETTDIVTKEMFTFADRKDRSLTLRPEGTAPIARAYIEHSLAALKPVTRLYYLGPMFRAERPQKGRSRQFYQIGVEVIGADSPLADVEVIAQLDKLLTSFGLNGFALKLNSLGCKADKAKYAGNLKAYLADKKNLLCEDCRKRSEKNIMRVLDCKNESCIQTVRGAPGVTDALCDGCKDHFEKVKSALTGLGVAFRETKNLVRGLDYYTGTVFEVTHPALGGQDAIGAGGRYDNLIEDMGGPAAGAVGYALGMERIIIALKEQGRQEPGRALVYIATMGEAAKLEGLKLAATLREAVRADGVVVVSDIGAASLKSQMRSADKMAARIVLILGEDELANGTVTVKQMRAGGEQASVAAASVVDEVRRRIC